MARPVVYLILVLLTLANIYLATFSVRVGEVNFFNDVARDFLLLREIDEKKIILIGPRSNTSGLFHGVVWSYLNYPAYVLGGGNPVVVAWFWILMMVVFLISSFLIAYELFSILPALAYVLLLSINLVTHINGLFHSEAPFFFMPFFIFAVVKYMQTRKVHFLALHLILAAIIMQLNVGVGIPLLMLSGLFTSLFILKNRLWKHYSAYLLVPLFLMNFIIFDARHGFQMYTAARGVGTLGQLLIPFKQWFADRVNHITSLQLIQNGNPEILRIIFIVLVMATIVRIKNTLRLRQVYLLIVFYYFGYMLLSYMNKGIILSHFVFLLIPLTSLWFVSLLEGKYRMVFLSLLALVYFLNLQQVNRDLKNFQESFMDKHPNSWRSLKTVADSVLKRAEGREFGYYVFSPDAFAYQPRYAMIYNFKAGRAEAFEYVKKDTTYVIAAPPPPNDPFMTYVWWRKNPVGIVSEPVAVEKFPNGYTVEEYQLTEAEQKIPHDKTIELGIHFR